MLDYFVYSIVQNERAVIVINPAGTESDLYHDYLTAYQATGPSQLNRYRGRQRQTKTERERKKGERYKANIHISFGNLNEENEVHIILFIITVLLLT